MGCCAPISDRVPTREATFLLALVTGQLLLRLATQRPFVGQALWLCAFVFGAGFARVSLSRLRSAARRVGISRFCEPSAASRTGRAERVGNAPGGLSF